MVGKILNSKARTITLAAFLVGGATLISGLLGVLKLRLLAGRFDVGFTLDSYFSAFRVPDFIAVAFMTGGVVVSFLPLFSQNFQKDEKKAWQLANNMVNISLVVFVLFSILIWFFAPQLVGVIAPGFEGAQQELTVSLTRIMLISPLIFALSGVFSGILQHFDRFLAYALAPIFYNIGIIFGILVLTNFFEETKMIYGVAWGVVIGAFLHLLIQIPPAIKAGYRYQFIFNIKDLELIKILKLILPRMISQASIQINLIVITAIASLMAAGSVAVFNFARNLYLFPVAVFGVSFAIAAFPSFSRSLANGRNEEFITNFFSTFRRIIFVMIPLSIMIFLLRAQIVRVILGTGEFGWTETRLTAAALGVFALGMVFTSLLPLMVRAFFSFQNTKTPALTSLLSVFFNIALSCFFVFGIQKDSFFYSLISPALRLTNIEDIRVVALVLAVSLATIFQFFLLVYFLKKEMKFSFLRKIGPSVIKIMSASVVMALASYLALRLALFFVQLTTFWAVLFQASFTLVIGVAIYLAILYLLDAREVKTFTSFLVSKIKK